MTLWDVNLDCISMINLIMCIGFSVDFSAHISYAYLSGRGLSADDRLREALHSLGLPILQGGVSTILAVGTLALAPSYIFITFFKTNFLVITFGMLHGMLLLPVLLSLLGPGSRCCAGRKSPESLEDKEGPKMAAIRYIDQKITLSLDEPLKIPRPCTTSLQIVTKHSVLHSSTENSQDLGLGTSAEEESNRSCHEGSTSAASDEGQSPVTADTRRPRTNRSLSLSAAIGQTNAGYTSDDELNSPSPAARSRVRPRSERGRPRNSHSQPASSRGRNVSDRPPVARTGNVP